MSEYDVRKQAYAAGEAYGTHAERRRIADQLDEIVGDADLQGKVLALISELQADDTTSGTRATTQSRTPGKVDPAAAIADAQRGGRPRAGVAPDLRARAREALASLGNDKDRDLDRQILESVAHGTADMQDQVAATMILRGL